MKYPQTRQRVDQKLCGTRAHIYLNSGGNDQVNTLLSSYIY